MSETGSYGKRRSGDMAEPIVESGVVTRAVAALEQVLAQPLRPGLHLVSTPIGNLADISLRALAVLENADLVFCEDTRHTRKLTTHFGLSRELHPYHEHNAARERPRILARIRAGQSVALVADAGTPLVSDPGYKLAREALDGGLAVFSVPGPSAVVAALTTSGLPSDRFWFEGFLPPKREARRKRLAVLSETPGTLIFFEAPSRLVPMLEDAGELLPGRDGAVVKELTKRHEALIQGALSELSAQASGGFARKGEFVVVAGPPPLRAVSDEEIIAALGALPHDRSLRDSAREVAEALGVSKSRVYKLGLALRESEG